MPDAPPVDTGEAVGWPVSRLTITIGYGPRCSTTGSVWPPASRPRGRPAAAAEREPRPRLHRRDLASRPAPTTRWSPSTRCVTWPGSGWASSRTTGWSSASAGSHHLHGAGHPAQPARLRGRHPQHQGRADRPCRTGTCGSARRRAGLDARRERPGGPLNPDVRGDLGPRRAERPGDVFGRRRRAAPRYRRAGVDPPGLRPGRGTGTGYPANAHIRLASGAQRWGAILRRGYPSPTASTRRRGTLDEGVLYRLFQEDPRAQSAELETQTGATPSTSTSAMPAASRCSPCPPACAVTSTTEDAVQPSVAVAEKRAAHPGQPGRRSEARPRAGPGHRGLRRRDARPGCPVWGHHPAGGTRPDRAAG